MKTVSSMMVIILLFGTVSAHAEQSETFGDTIVHYNAITTDSLTPAIASHYGITRSKSRALLNVAVLRQADEGQLDTAIPAQVTVSATNLVGQRQTIPMRMIQEQDAIYYIGVSKVAHRETLNYFISVQTEDMTRPVEVRYTREFYTD